MASPSRPASQNRTPTVPSVRMASPEPLRSRNDLTSMEVNHILVLIGSDPIGLLLSERRDQVLSLSREDSRITQDGCSGRTRWSSSLNCSTTYTSSIVAMLLLIHDHVSF